MSFRPVNRHLSADDCARDAAGGSGVAPAARTGVVRSGAGWAFDDALTIGPDAFVRSYTAGETFTIDTHVGSGLVLGITAGVPHIHYP